jgi:streptogramin lyase
MEESMPTTRLLPALMAGVAAIALCAAPAVAQNAPAITGQVTSDAEGAMEGVVVNAKKIGSTVMVSVISDAKGHYSFPANRLEPGQYAISIRAVGYDLGATKADVVADRSATVDLKLAKTKNLSAQLSNAEWIASMPGTEDQKAYFLNCVSCHTLERIVRSTHTADEFTQVMSRMSGYGAVSQPIKPQRMLDEGRVRDPEIFRKPAEFAASINLSNVDRWEYPLKVLARPTGRATHVIITEYDLKRPTTEPHDVLVDPQGMVWYSDFGEPYITRFDPKTLKITEFPVQDFKPAAPKGNLSIEFDKFGTIWFDTMYQGSLGALDPKTEKVTWYPLAPEYNDNRVQLNFVGLHHEVDGKVWTKSVGTQDIYRLELASGKWERFQPLKQLDNGPSSIYQVISDSKNNLWMAEFQRGHIGKIDAKTGEVTWRALPTANARARRIWVDDQDRLLITEYRGNKVAMLDTNTDQLTEYQLPPYTFPYRAAADKNGEIWAGGMHTDRVVRLNPKTGESVEYQLPTETNMRSVFVDNTTTPVTFWTGSNHKAALVKVEPLD